ISGSAGRAAGAKPLLCRALSRIHVASLANPVSQDSPCRFVRILPAAFLALMCWGEVGRSADAVEKIQGQLSVRDALSAPGKPVRIEAKLTRTGLGQPGLGGEPLELLIEGGKAIQAMTGGDGRAWFDATCRMRGAYTLTVKVAGSPRVDSPDATGTLACWEHRRPILLVDLAALAKPFRAPFDLPPGLSLPVGSAEPEPIAEAAEELKRLTEYFYNILYLSWPQQGGWSGETDAQTWLRRAKFPTGPLVTVRPGPAGLAELLAQLKADGWDNVKVGIGRTKEFAETMVAHRIETVIFPAGSRDEDVPKKAHLIKDWREIRKKLRS
ncbi:MAG: hypothetical protein KGJ14_08125, partial [Nitrospirota bacterium]|nr:hypothetical protein [Nitrospirota bacterium]